MPLSPISAARRRLAAAALVAVVLVILVATLTPVDSTSSEGLFACLICGERGLADVILNVILFTPVGVLAAFVFGTRRRVVLIGAVLSAMIEVLQVWIPGRDASIGDLVFNTTGTLVGMAIVATSKYWLRPSRRALPRWVVAAALLPIMVSLAHAWLVRPSLPSSTWYGMWSPDLRHLRPWDGTVLESTVGGHDVRHGRIRDRDPIRSALLDGDTIVVHAIAGNPTTGLGAIFAIYDGDRREMVLVGPDRRDLVLRTRLRAQDVRLDHPDLRLHDALARFQPGDSLHLRARIGAADGCLEVNGEGQCGLAMSVADGWKLLLYPSHFPQWLQTLLSAVWVAALLMPAGFFSRSPQALAAGAAAGIIAFLIVPAFDPWLTIPPIVPWLGAMTGFALAFAIARRISASRDAAAGFRGR